MNAGQNTYATRLRSRWLALKNKAQMQMVLFSCVLQDAWLGVVHEICGNTTVAQELVTQFTQNLFN